jgi:hypothetical protein
VTALKFAAGSVDTGKLATDAVTTIKILDANVTTAKLANAAVDTGKLADGAVTSVKLAAGSVDTTKLATDAVTTIKILDANVTTAKLANAAVDTGKLATDSVTSVKILNGAVTRTKLNDIRYAVKTLDQSVSNSTVLANDTDLFFTVVGGETWAFEFVLMVSNNNSSTPDWKCAILAPASSTGKALLSGLEPGSSPQITLVSTTNIDNTPGTLVDASIAASLEDFTISITGYVTAGAGVGIVRLQFAENTAGGGTSITVRRGSILRAYRQ